MHSNTPDTQSAGLGAGVGSGAGFGVGLPEWQSLLANYVTDVDDCGTYILRLSEEETRKLWDEVDAQTIELKRLRSACFVFLEAVKHKGYGMEDAERAIRAALSPNVKDEPRR